VKLAVGVAILLVVVAAAALTYGALRGKTPAKHSLATADKASSSPSASPSPTLGPYGHIATRSSDPDPLTVTQLFPASFNTGRGVVVTQTASRVSGNCSDALVGANIQAAATEADCSQVVRATYLSAKQGLMGTIGVLNLKTASGATKAAGSADASDFIHQLAAKHGPTRKIGRGTGIEEALAKGHYLILIWAEFTNLKKPKTAAERTRIETFMTELLDDTANQSLTTRMLTGVP
jgi:hypothetical protein